MQLSQTIPLQVIHKYWINPTGEHKLKLPGFADFLRGTIALRRYCELFKYNLYIDYDSHPIFQHFTYDKDIYIKDHKDDSVYEILPSKIYKTYPQQHIELTKIFASNRSFSLITNSFYTRNLIGELINYGPLRIDEKTYLKKLLNPDEKLTKSISQVRQLLKLVNTDYHTLHLRFGDAYFQNKKRTECEYLASVKNAIEKILNQINVPLVLITDSSSMGFILKEEFPNLYYWYNNKSHIGHDKNSKSGIKDALVDFFLMSQSSCIHWGALDRIKGWYPESGFSTICSLIFDVPMRKAQINV